MDDVKGPNRAVMRLKAGKASAVWKVEVTTPGLLAISALVSSILLSTAVLVWSSTGVPRKHPMAYGLMRRR